MVDILESIKKKKIKSAKSSYSFSEKRDQIVHNKAEYTKTILSRLGNGDVENYLELELANNYYSFLDSYDRNNNIRMPNSFSKRSMSLWKRVAVACKKSEVSPKKYIKAQFVYFHRVLGKPPEVYQLATKKAIERAIEYTGREGGKIVGNRTNHKTDIAESMKFGEKQMQDLMRIHKMSREEVYRNFILTGLFSLPKAYMEADPVYNKL